MILRYSDLPAFPPSPELEDLSNDPNDPDGLATCGAMWQLNLDGSISGPTNLGLFYPSDINDYGVMTGRYLGYPAVAWFDGTSLNIVQLNSSIRFFGADANALNDYPITDSRLTVVGRYFRDDNNNSVPMSGFVWRPFDATDPTTLLSTLGGDNTEPFDVNRAGQVVGWSDTKRSGQQAFIYENGRVSSLNSMVDTGKNTLKRAIGINEDGDIVGYMRIPRPISEERGFFLRPITP